MNEQLRNSMEEMLEMATRWEGGQTELWAKALDAESAGATASRRERILARVRRPSSLIAASVALFVVVAVVMQLMTPRARYMGGFHVADSATDYRREEGPASSPMASEMHAYRGGGAPPVSAGVPPAAAAPVSEPMPPERGEGRVVIRKATIELETTDVRAAFAKAGMLVSEAAGEYVQDSSLTGGGAVAEGAPRQPLHATMTLRIGVNRLSSVMSSLRDLGTVTSENSGGEDVTGQAVDLEARLRNEQRVEAELLELMDRRKDAPLKDVLELREQIGRVRERVELLTAHRDRLSHLASLATVLVVIREPATEGGPVPTDGSPRDYFSRGVHDAWRSGLRTLSDSVSWLVSVLVGGAIWWAVLVLVLIAVVRLTRRPSPVPPAPRAPTASPESPDSASNPPRA